MKILWRNSHIEKETWEKESEMKRKYPKLFAHIGMNLNFEDEIYKGGECKIPSEETYKIKEIIC